MRTLALALSATLTAAALAGCDLHRTPAPKASTAVHEAPLGLDCTPVDGADACTIAVTNAGAPGCEILHSDGAYTFQCAPEDGWRRIGRTDDGKHGVCYLHVPNIVACSDGWRG
jgi:hypothetical protein